ncbi:unnamed protein product [Macrosiphum euphorbiae]|uniref:Uncharacterized protein n=1 Tax=Macrosiphum euphorbiae TaxID=13131 RepID=A0AAV0VGI7_9HEMI|nr:unnamed protein product [Macrosiphum euphorbiae]
MIDHPNPLRILPVAIFIIFLLTEGLCRKSHSKNIILENEEDVIVLTKKGSNLKVKCHYSEGYEPDDYEWKKIKDNRHFAVLPTETLSTSQWLDLVNVRFDDEGQYSCIMNGFKGNETFSEKRDFVLKTTNYTREPYGKMKPKFQKVFTEDVPLFVNRTLHLNCPFTSTSDTQFSWSKNNELLNEKKAIIEGFGAIDNEYSLKLSKLSDAGNYTCVVKNKYGSIQNQFTVIVYDDENKKPLSFEYPRDLSLKSGDSAMFFCHAFDYGNKEINWYFLNSTNPMNIDIETVDLSQFKKMDNDIDVTLLSGKLIIDPVTIHDAGWYICVQKGFERPLMAEAQLIVEKSLIKVTSVEDTNQDENISDDKHFVLSLLPMLSTLPMDKKLKARIAIETLVHNIAFPDLNAAENTHAEEKNTTEKSSTNTDSIITI